MEWQNDKELFQLMKDTLYTPVVGDVMDTINLRHQFLPAMVQPIDIGMKVVGRAMPVEIEASDGSADKPFGYLTEALDQLESGDVYLASCDYNCAAWGELLTATARVRGAVGAVINGYHRDTPQIMAQNWPVFSWGGYAQDMAVRAVITGFRKPIRIGRVRVNPGDIVFGDRDGVLIIPQDKEVEIITKSLEKARGEKAVRAAIENGMSSTEAFATFGIL